MPVVEYLATDRECGRLFPAAPDGLREISACSIDVPPWTAAQPGSRLDLAPIFARLDSDLYCPHWP